MNKEKFDACIPIDFRTAGRSIKTQIDEVMSKLQSFNKFDKFELLDSEILDCNEKITCSLRDDKK
jgi:hypothetical protein